MTQHKNHSGTMDIEMIKQRLPHRYPFLLVDRVTSMELNQQIVGYKNISINEPFFNGHFPQKAVMPGVLQVEALAQISGLLLLESVGFEEGASPIFYFAGIDAARFKRVVVPGDQLWLRAEVLKARKNLWKFKAEASIVQAEGDDSDSIMCCSCELMLIKEQG